MVVISSPMVHIKATSDEELQPTVGGREVPGLPDVTQILMDKMANCNFNPIFHVSEELKISY